MEALHDVPMLTFHPDTLEVVRKSVNVDSQRAMDEAIDILEIWIKKQDHFTKKDFSRSYLERIIIKAKGSVERSKERLDKMCTARTVLPEFFKICSIKDLKTLSVIDEFVLPKLTKDHCRIFFIQNVGQEFSSQFFTEYYLRLTYLLEYISAYDYHLGIYAIFDFRYLNMMELIKRMDITQLANAASLILNSFGLRIKGIHIISTSKLVGTLVAILKQVLTEKLGQRIQVHNEIEAVYKCFDKDLLPVEFGGLEVSRTELYKNCVEALSSEKFLEYMKELNEFKTNEALRRKDKLSKQILGMPGTFRSLAVD